MQAMRTSAAFQGLTFARWAAPLLAMLLALFAFSHEAAAVTRCVNPGGTGGCLATIQAAVTASGPNDRIELRPGVYFENVAIPAGKNGLTITGVAGDGCNRGAPILDASPPRIGSVDGDGVTISSANVTLECFTIRLGDTGIVALAGADGLRVTRMRVLSSDEDHVLVTANGWVIERSEFAYGDGEGLELTGNNGRVTLNEIFAQGDGCLSVTGNGNRIENNVIISCEDDEGIFAFGNTNVIVGNSVVSTDGVGIAVDGDTNQILRNEARGINDTCIDVNGTSNRIEGNRASACIGGYEISGANMVVLNNRAELISDVDGFDIDCSTACAAGLVQGNFASGANNDDEGFDIFVTAGTGAGFRILNNIAGREPRGDSAGPDQDCFSSIRAAAGGNQGGENQDGGPIAPNIGNADGGFTIDGDGLIITGNIADCNGNEEDPGFEIDGDNNQISNNVARFNYTDGFEIDGSNNTIRNNRAVGNGNDGIDITSGTGNTVDNNTALNNIAEGIENNATATVLTNNRSSGNRIDCANSGTIATNTGNVCADGSNFTIAPQIDR